MKRIPYRFYLTEEQMPQQWYNLRADMVNLPAPMLVPGTNTLVKESDLYGVFPTELAHQELDHDTRYVDIPGPVLDLYRIYRPSPLVRAYNLERELDTPAKIYFKFEGNNTSGSHKLNSAIAQTYYAKKQGLSSLTTETGAGQWGTALSEACAYFGVPLTVFMVKISSIQKPDRRAVMESFGAKVIPSPSNTTHAGRALLLANPEDQGSLGTAISEAVELAAGTEGCRYVLGSVLNQVLLHQSIIGLEAKQAMDTLGEYPDVIVGCAGGGSNLGGLIAPYMRDKLTGKSNPRIVAVEPKSCPSLTRGRYAYDFCDTGKITPLAKMYTLGCTFKPSANHAGGLRYHGMSPVISRLYHDGYMEAVSVKQRDVFEAATLFSRCETILPAPESAHAIWGAIDEALRCRKSGEPKTILFGLTGTGYFDLAAYTSYHKGNMRDTIPTDEELEMGFAALPIVPVEYTEERVAEKHSVEAAS